MMKKYPTFEDLKVEGSHPTALDARVERSFYMHMEKVIRNGEQQIEKATISASLVILNR